MIVAWVELIAQLISGFGFRDGGGVRSNVGPNDGEPVDGHRMRTSATVSESGGGIPAFPKGALHSLASLPRLE